MVDPQAHNKFNVLLIFIKCFITINSNFAAMEVYQIYCTLHNITWISNIYCHILNIFEYTENLLSVDVGIKFSFHFYLEHKELLHQIKLKSIKKINVKFKSIQMFK